MTTSPDNENEKNKLKRKKKKMYLGKNTMELGGKQNLLSQLGQKLNKQYSILYPITF